MSGQSSWESVKRWIDALSGLSVIATMIFIALQWREMRLGSADTHDLAAAAKAQADAAKAQAEDTKTIAESARSQAINTQSLATSTAAEVSRLDASVKQAARLASATEKANSEVIDSDRPWLGIALAVEGFEVGKTPIYTITFLNSGKRPARVTHADAFSGPGDFGDKPVYPSFGMTPSASVIVPGQSGGASWRDEGASMNPVGVG